MHQICIGFGQAGVNLLHSYALQNPLNNSKYLFVDNDYETIEKIMKTNKFSPKCFVKGKRCTASNWISGNVQSQIRNQFEQSFCRIIQSIDKPTGIKIFCSLAGGTGSSMLNRISIPCAKLAKIGFVVWPNTKYKSCQNVVSPYNTILGLQQLENFLDMNIIIQNQEFYKNFKNDYQFKDINDQITKPLFILKDIDKIKNSLCSSKLFKLFNCYHLESKQHYSTDYLQNGKQINSMLISNTQQYMANTIPVFNKMNYQIQTLKIESTTKVQHRLKKVIYQFQKLYRNRSFVHWYVGTGISQGFFQSALNVVSQIYSNYQNFSP